MGLDKEEFAIFQIVLLSIATIANVAIVILFIKERRYKKTYDFAYLNLALSDILVGFQGAAFNGRATAFGINKDFLCYFASVFGSVALIANFLSILPISYDRFIAVMMPLQYNRPSHMTILKMQCGLCWVLSCLLWGSWAIAVYIREEQNVDRIIIYNNRSCDWNWAPWHHESSYIISAITMVTPLIITIAVYAAIAYRISLSPKLRALNSTMITVRAMIMCLIFSMSWIPAQIVRSVTKLTTQNNLQITQAILYLNCLTDPLIYTFTPTTFSLCLSKVRHGITVTLSEAPRSRSRRGDDVESDDDNVELYQNNQARLSTDNMSFNLPPPMTAATRDSSRHVLSTQSPAFRMTPRNSSSGTTVPGQADP